MTWYRYNGTSYQLHWESTFTWLATAIIGNKYVITAYLMQAKCFLEHWYLQCCYWKLETLQSSLFSSRHVGTWIGSGGIRSSSSTIPGCCSSAASYLLFVSSSSFVCWSLYMSATKYVLVNIVFCLLLHFLINHICT